MTYQCFDSDKVQGQRLERMKGLSRLAMVGRSVWARTQTCDGVLRPSGGLRREGKGREGQTGV